MNYIEVMKQALEALEYHTDQTRPIWKTEQAIVTLTKAIAEQQRDWSLLEATQDSLREHMAEVKRLKALLEQSAPAQELTDWERVAKVQDAKLRAMCNDPGAFEKLCELMDRYETLRPTPPAAQPAVPLTDGQIHTLWRNHPNRTNIVDVVRAIEAAHGINGEPK